jgi:hypothetical protein
MITQENDRSDPDPPNLVDCGDWACAHCDCGGLADVARRLAQHAGDEERGLLKEIERLASIDMLAASTMWSLFVTAGRRAVGNRTSE